MLPGMLTLSQIELNLRCVLNTHCQEAKTEKKKKSTFTILVYMYSGTAMNRTNFKTTVKFMKVSDLPNDSN